MADFECRKLFVGGIPRGTPENVLNDYFSQYGEVLSLTIAKDRMSDTPRGFGFVTFADPSSADKALIDRHEILGRRVEVKKAIPRSAQPQFHHSHQETSISSTNTNRDNQFRTKKIFVGGLRANLTEEEFKGYFEKFGRITDVVVMHDNITNKPRGFGFITFDSEDVVEEVVLKDNFHEISGKRVEVKRAIPKDPHGHNSRLGELASSYDSYNWGANHWPENFWHGFYSSNEYTSPHGYNSVCNARYQMGSGLGMPMVYNVYPWNGFQMARYVPLPYNFEPAYHMNGVSVNNVQNGNLSSGVRQSNVHIEEII